VRKAECPDCGPEERPANCRWATRREQQRNTRSNRRLTVRGRTLILTEWAAATGIGVTTIVTRIRRGWSVEDAILTRPSTDRREVKPFDPEHGRWLRVDHGTRPDVCKCQR
jgi:hypothetical protein